MSEQAPHNESAVVLNDNETHPFLMGSTAARVMRHASSAVLVARPSEKARELDEA